MEALPTIVATVRQAVCDFGAWKRAFDSRAHRRQEAGILGHRIYRCADDPALLCVLLPASDRAKLEGFLINEYVTVRLRNAGIASPPSVAMLVPQEDRTARGRTSLAAASVSIDVESYERWKAAFDADRETRHRAGVVGHAVNRSATDPSRVVVYLQAESAAELRAILGSSGFAARLQRAGVRSPPDISFLEDTGYAEECPS